MGQQVTVRQTETKPEIANPENTKKINHPDYLSMKERQRRDRRRKNKSGKIARRRARAR